LRGKLLHQGCSRSAHTAQRYRQYYGRGTPATHTVTSALPPHRIVRQTGTTQVPSVRILVSWNVKQDRACPAPIGAFLQYRGQDGYILDPPHTRAHTAQRSRQYYGRGTPATHTVTSTLPPPTHTHTQQTFHGHELPAGACARTHKHTHTHTLCERNQRTKGPCGRAHTNINTHTHYTKLPNT
jgi:hypothetical protein